MKNPYIKKFGAEMTSEGFQILWEAHFEDLNVANEFEDEFTTQKIYSGEYELFTVRGVAMACGVELADVWFGGCLYHRFEDFLAEPEAVELRKDLASAARIKLAELADFFDSVAGASEF